MRQEFSHRSLHGHPRARRRLLIATVLILGILGVDILTGGTIRGVVRTASASVWNVTASLRNAVRNSGFVSRRSSLAKENAALRTQLAEYQERAAGYAALLSENDSLRTMLSLAQLERGITAPVISSFRASPYGTFLIGAGEGDAAVGSLVLTEGGFVVGKIVEVDAHTALVGALFSSDTNTDARIRSNAVVVEGRGGGNARALLPRGIDVQAGDIVTAPSFRNRPIGIVGSVETDASQSEQTAFIRLPLDISSLAYVYIVPAH